MRKIIDFFRRDKNQEENSMGRLDESYWNNKWPKAPIIYNGRALRGKSDRIGVDVKNFIVTNDELLRDVISKYRLKKRDHDETAWAVQKWVVKFLTYKYDEESVNCPEFWQFPFESLQSAIGDCEDGAILITSLLINAGVPSWRCKVAAGYVQSSPTAPQGGHGYAIYLANDGEWRILDWCYYEDSRTRVQDKPLAKNGGYNNCYKETWFTFNNEFSWNQESLRLGARITEGPAGETSERKEELLNEGQTEIDDIMSRIDEKVGDFEA